MISPSAYILRFQGPSSFGGGQDSRFLDSPSAQVAVPVGPCLFRRGKIRWKFYEVFSLLDLVQAEKGTEPRSPSKLPAEVRCGAERGPEDSLQSLWEKAPYPSCTTPILALAVFEAPAYSSAGAQEGPPHRPLPALGSRGPPRFAPAFGATFCKTQVGEGKRIGEFDRGCRRNRPMSKKRKRLFGGSVKNDIRMNVHIGDNLDRA